MKKILTLILVCAFSIPALAQLSEADRMFAIKYLKATHNEIIKTVSELDDETFNHTPEDGGWSVSNCLEHILVTESAFHGMVQGGLADSEVDPELDLSIADGVIIGTMTNRGFQATTAEQFEPTGKWSSKAEMLKALKESRNTLIVYLETTDHDLRHHKMTLPLGDVDAYQIYLLVAAHSQRHTSQMVEVLHEMEAM